MGYNMIEELEKLKKKKTGDKTQSAPVSTGSSTGTGDLGPVRATGSAGGYDFIGELQKAQERREAINRNPIISAPVKTVTVTGTGELGPVRVTGTDQNPKQGSGWFQLGALDDGLDDQKPAEGGRNIFASMLTGLARSQYYQNGGGFNIRQDQMVEKSLEAGGHLLDKLTNNTKKATLGTGVDIAGDLTKGAVGAAERMWDGMVALGPVVTEVMWDQNGGYYNMKATQIMQEGMDAAKAEMGEYIAQDLIKEEEIADRLITDPARKKWGVEAEEDSVLGERIDGYVQSVGDIGARALLGPAGKVASFLSVAGGEAENAFRNGASYKEAMLSGTISGAAEVATEALFGGIKFGGKTLTEGMTKKIASTIPNKTLATLAKWGFNTAGEGAEEVLADGMTAVGQKLSYMSQEELSELFTKEDAWEAFLGGLVVGGFFEGANIGKAKIAGTDYGRELGHQEKTVVDAVYQDRVAQAEGKGKVTPGEKSRIYKKVLEDMEKGRLSTDQIEAAIGGDSYTSYREAVEQEAAIRKEFDALNKMKQGEMTGEQIDRRTELKQQLEEMKKTDRVSQLQEQLRQEVRGKVKQERLLESYLEQDRRKESFTADLRQYDAKQRAVIQNAIDSGILNNTNRTHEFVELVAKISGDKDIPFQFANNERLKESGFSLTGKTVNGYVSKDGVTVNIQSAKALNTVVGHEIAHVLENTDLYQPMQEMLIKYAQSKGEYDSRLESITKLYEGIEGADIQKELTADLIGDYLFTDENFVRQLSTENRNVFQKFYDEIKYLCKVATAGSKEAVQLEKLKKSFAEVYRNSGKSEYEPDGPHATDEVQYSLAKDTAYMDKAMETNDAMHRVDSGIMLEAKTVRENIATKMNEIKDKGLVALPADIEGNTAIANSSYDVTEENTTICPRSLAAESFVDAVSEYLGRPLTIEEQIYISQDLQGRSMTPECTYCYVATDRKAYRAFLGAYVSQRDAVIQKVRENPNADVSRNGDLYKEFLNGRTDTNPMYKRFKMWVDAYKTGKPMIEASHLANINKLMGDINSEFGAELKPQIVDAMKYAQSASWAKKRVNYVAYNGHILKWKQSRIDKLNSHYGLRMYSFSDFHPAFVLENMQMITDAAVRGLKVLGYTKDTDFVEIYAPSGMNINISTFGFESNGNIYENNIIGAEWEKAKSLREKYPNVGITFVATNDKIVEWALDQEWIDVVIPYHLVRTGAEVAKAFGYTNYTSESSDGKTKEWGEGDKKYIAPTEHNNDKATYLDALKKNHLKPRFQRFLNHPNYMKLVNECRLSASESKPVQPVFDQEAAMAALAKLEANGYYQPIGGSVERMYEIAAEVAEDMSREIGPVKQSLSAEGTQAQTYGSYNVYGEDVALQGAETETAAAMEDTGITGENGSVAADSGPVTEQQDLITMRLERDKTALENVYQAKKARMEAEVKDKNAFISKRAKALYEQLRSLKKGERASEELSPLLDLMEGKDWSPLRSALVNIQHTPDRQVNLNSSVENAARELLNDSYEDAVYEIYELEQAHQVDIKNLEADAARERAGEGGPNEALRKGVRQKTVEKITNAQLELEKNRINRNKIIEDYNEQIAEAKAELEGKKRTDTKIVQTLKRRIDRLTRLRDDATADYDRRIAELEERVEKLYSTDFSRAEYRRAKEKEYTQMWEDELGDTSKWEDLKTGLQYKTKTLRRILRKVVRNENGNPDFAKADRIYDKLETEYDRLEAELKVESKRLKEVFFRLDLNRHEDAYAHMMGEVLHNPKTQLSPDTVREFYEAHKDKIDTQKVDTAIKEARQLFDQLILRVNDRLREQGFKEIPYRQGYFPHFVKPKQNLLQKVFNWKPIDNEIPTSIAGITETFKPRRSWQSFDKQRMGDKTDYSLLQGLDSYIHGSLDWIYHIENLQQRRALENHLRYTHSDEYVKKKIDEIRELDLDADETQMMINGVLEQARNPLGGLVRELMNRTNTLANKKSSMDRGVEDWTNRKVYSTMTNLNSRINANMVVGSISSALTNFIPIVQSWHMVDPVYTVSALKDTVRSAIQDDGTIKKSVFLSNRLVEEEKLYKGFWDNVTDKAAVMMNVVDGLTSQTVWRSKYLQNLDEGMSEAAAVKDADQFAKNLIAGRSRGNMPTIFEAKNPFIKLATAFQLEVANQYGFMLEDVVQDSTSQARLVKGYATAFLGAYLYNAFYSSLVGRDAAFDPIGIIEELLQGLFDEDEEDKLEVLMDFGDNILDEVPYISGLTGGGRIPLSSAIPYSSEATPIRSMLNDVETIREEGNWTPLLKEALKPLWYLVLPVGGGQLKKTVEGVGMFLGDKPVTGSYTDGGKLRFPVEANAGNVVKAALFGQYASKNARTYFEEGYAPLSEEQTGELKITGIPIEEYWEYLQGLKGKDSFNEEANYIAGLDLPLSTKNILVNNRTDRKEPIDLAPFDKYGDFEEMDFAIHNPEKYAAAQAVGGYEKYKAYKEAMSGMDLDQKADYIAGLPLTTEQKNIFINSEANRTVPIDLAPYDQYGDLEEMDFAIKNPEKYAAAQAVGDFKTYMGYREDMADMDIGEKADYIAGLPLTTEQKNILINSESDRKTPIDLTGYENYGSFAEFEYARDNPEGYAMAKAVGGYAQYMEYSQALGDIYADKDEYGNSINGSRKAKVQAYIEGLDADNYTKLLLYKSQYKSFDDYNREIVEYINGMELTLTEKIGALRRLGFDVDAKGNVFW